eukprot:COSAG01_NODE_5723_length_4074_cov_49.724277_7_plen_230_part_01
MDSIYSPQTAQAAGVATTSNPVGSSFGFDDPDNWDDDNPFDDPPDIDTDFGASVSSQASFGGGAMETFEIAGAGDHSGFDGKIGIKSRENCCQRLARQFLAWRARARKTGQDKLIAILVAVVLAIGLAGYFAMQSTEKPPPPPQTPPHVPEPEPEISPRQVYFVAGKAFQGNPYQGCKVCLDLDGDGHCSKEWTATSDGERRWKEPQAISGPDGTYKIYTVHQQPADVQV